MEALLAHRTIRRFRETPITDQQLEHLVRAGIRASNTGNLQTYCLIATRDPQRRSAMAPLHFNQPPAVQAPLLLTVCIDYARIQDWCQIRNATPGYSNLLGILSATIDASLFAQNITLAAEQMGLGVCFLGTTLYSIERVCELLRLPQGVIPLCTLAVGHPDEQPELTPRLPLRAVLHHETYQERTPADTHDIHEEFENLPQHQRFVQEHNLRTLPELITRVRYPAQTYTDVSRIIARALQAQGFSLP